jgi:hypothetical protein
VHAQYDSKSLNWNTAAYDKVTYSGPEGTMPYRLLKPGGYDKSKKYPLVIMLHGKGEGRGTACSAQYGADCVLSWGGHMHLDYNAKYPGFVVFPQTWGGDWGDQPLKIVRGIIAKITQTYSIDLDRVYIHGLSAGGQGTWRQFLAYPQAFAAFSPHSAAGDAGKAGQVIFTPMWTVQGEKDTNPRMSVTMYMMNRLQSLGKHPVYTLNATTHQQVWPNINTTEPIYTLVPNGGHVVWPVLYNNKVWLPWLFNQKRSKIIAIGGTDVSGGKTVTLGVSPGFLAYEWSNGSTTNQIKVNRAGTYRVRYKRYANVFSGPQVWSNWSDPITITGPGAPLAHAKIAAEDKPESSSFTLVNKDDNSDIRSLHDGDQISLSELPTHHLNIRINLDSLDAKEVVFELDGKKYTDDQLPFTLYGDHQFGFKSKNLSGGHHKLSAHVKLKDLGEEIKDNYEDLEYREPDVINGPDLSFDIEFTIVDDKAPHSQDDGVEESELIKVYPNPIHDKFFVELADESDEGKVNIYDRFGMLIHTYPISRAKGSQPFEINLSELGLTTGIYTVKVISSKYNEKTVRVFKE